MRWTGRLLPRSQGRRTRSTCRPTAPCRLTPEGRRHRARADRSAAPRARPRSTRRSRSRWIRSSSTRSGSSTGTRAAPATLSLQFGTGPGAKQPVPTRNLYPADGLSSFAPVEQSYRRLHKAALHPDRLRRHRRPARMADRRAAVPGPRRAADGAGRGGRRRRAVPALAPAGRASTRCARSCRARTPTCSTCSARATLARGAGAAGAGHRAGSAASSRRSSARRAWRSTPSAGLAPAGGPGRGAGDPAPGPRGRRAAPASAWRRRRSYAWANSVPDADGAAAIVQAVKARYDETRWLEVARTLNDPLRAERRDALVAYLLPRLRDLGVTQPQPALRVLPHRRGHEPVHAHVARSGRPPAPCRRSSSAA